MKTMAYFLVALCLFIPAVALMAKSNTVDTVELIEKDGVKYWSIEVIAESPSEYLAGDMAKTRGLNLMSHYLASSDPAASSKIEYKILKTKFRNKLYTVKMGIWAPVSLNPMVNSQNNIRVVADTVEMVTVDSVEYYIAQITMPPMKDFTLARTIAEDRALRKMSDYLNQRGIDIKSLECDFSKSRQSDGRYTVTATIRVPVPQK